MNQETPTEFDYEIHITVKTNDVAKFQDACALIGVKAIAVQLSENGEKIDVMTSSTMKDDETMWRVRNEADRIIISFEKFGIYPIRAKIETVPWHPQAPALGNKNFFKVGQYFECHFAFVIRSPEEAGMISVFAKRKNLHLSRNAFKTNEDGSYVQMLTSRAFMSKYEIFKDAVDEIVNSSKKYNFVLDKEPRIEFAIYDTNVNHDDEWLKSRSSNSTVFNPLKFKRHNKKFTT